MTTGLDGSSESGAADFARRREERHRTARRQAALVGAVLVLVGAVTAGVLVAYGVGGDPERDRDGRLVPPDGLALDAESAAALVAEGTWPGDDRVEGMPGDDAARLGWLLTEVSWDQEQADALGEGLQAAVGDDPDLAVALTRGVAGARRSLVDALAEPVMRSLGGRPEAVAASLAGAPPGDGEPRLEEADLLATFAAVGLDAAGPLETELVVRMEQGWRRSVPAAGRDDPGAAQRFTAGYEEQFRRWVQPVVLLYAGLAREECGPGVERQCRRALTAHTARADATVAALVLDSIPRELLPREVGRALGDDVAAHRRLPPAAARVWERFRTQQGYGVYGPVLDALAG